MGNQENNYYATTEPEQKKKKRIVNSPVYQQLIVFLSGWLGLKLLANLIVLIIKAVNPSFFDKEASGFAFNEALLEFIIYGILFVTILVELGLPIIKRTLKDFASNKTLMGLLYGFGALFAQIAYNLIVSLFYKAETNANQSAVNSTVLAAPALAFFFVVIFAPVCEEATYRFGLVGILNRINKYFAIIGSALIFGLIHFDFNSVLEAIQTHETASLIRELVALPSYVLCGLIFGYAFYKEDSLATSITAHATNNLIAFATTFIPAGVIINVF